MQIDLGKIKLTWRGSYSPATEYEKDDLVFHDVSSYICVADTPATGTAPTPGQSNATWKLFAKGSSGTLATQAEAEAGSDNTRMMTPRRVKQAVDKHTPRPNIVQKHVAAPTLYAASTDRHIAALDKSIHIAAGSRVRITVNMAYERQHNAMFYLKRGSTEIGSSASEGHRFKGLIPVAHDVDLTTTMASLTLDYIDSPALTAAGRVTYSVHVRGGNHKFALNRTVSDANIDYCERATSTVILEEIRQ